MVRRVPDRIGKDPVTFGRAEIEGILPHRGRWGLLDSVLVHDRTAFGNIVLTNEICGGHVLAGVPLAPGCIWYDAAAQLMGVVLSLDNEVLSRLPPGGILAVRKYGEAIFKGPLRPGDEIVVEASTEFEFLDRHGLFMITGGPFNVKILGESACRVKVGSVTLIPVSREDVE